MANYFARIEKYMSDAVDTVFATESKTALLENGSKYIDLNFKEVGYVKVLNILMDGLSDYYRVGHVGVEDTESYAHDNGYNGIGTRDGYDRGNVQGTWELFKLEYDRGRQFLVDNMDNEEMAGSIIANLLSEFLRTKVVPEVDAIRFSKIAKKCKSSLGNLVTETVADNEIITKFNTAFEWLTENEVPEEEQVIFVNPSIYTKIMQTSELHKVIVQQDFTNEKGVKFTLPAYNGRPIVQVPSSRFYTDVKTTSNGYAPTSDSKVINYMVVSKKAIVPIVKLNKSKIWNPETQDDFDGYKVNFRLYHDVIIPNNKVIGSFVSVSSTVASTKVGKLAVDYDVNTTTETITINGYFTQPAGKLGTLLLYISTAPAIGATVTLGTGSYVVTPGETYDVSEFGVSIGGAQNLQFALIDSKNIVIATTKK